MVIGSDWSLNRIPNRSIHESKWILKWWSNHPKSQLAKLLCKGGLRVEALRTPCRLDSSRPFTFPTSSIHKDPMQSIPCHLRTQSSSVAMGKDSKQWTQSCLKTGTLSFNPLLSLDTHLCFDGLQDVLTVLSMRPLRDLTEHGREFTRTICMSRSAQGNEQPGDK